MQQYQSNWQRVAHTNLPPVPCADDRIPQCLIDRVAALSAPEPAAAEPAAPADTTIDAAAPAEAAAPEAADPPAAAAEPEVVASAGPTTGAALPDADADSQIAAAINSVAPAVQPTDVDADRQIQDAINAAGGDDQVRCSHWCQHCLITCPQRLTCAFDPLSTHNAGGGCGPTADCRATCDGSTRARSRRSARTRSCLAAHCSTPWPDWQCCGIDNAAVCLVLSDQV